VAVVGASGRVGGAIVRDLSTRYEVVAIQRSSPDERARDVARRAVAARPDILINAAGVAHVHHATEIDLQRLETANVEFPAALAAAALEERISMIHISSVKAVDERARSSYALSKRRGDETLEREFGPRFADAGLSLIIVLPLALLFPPLDAGKIARLKLLRWWPAALTPSIQLPVLTPVVFLGTLNEVIARVAAGSCVPGVSRRGYERSERGTLRDVGQALKSEARRVR
jgi:nucleoside-diphosphate-sugar epimerase